VDGGLDEPNDIVNREPVIRRTARCVYEQLYRILADRIQPQELGYQLAGQPVRDLLADQDRSPLLEKIVADPGVGTGLRPLGAFARVLADPSVRSLRRPPSC
jgi:hypothetical protein